VNLQAGADEFVLGPVDASVSEQGRGRSGTRRRRRLVVDAITMIKSEAIKYNISYVDDIVRQSVDLAPPTKRLMACKQSYSVETMFTHPGHHVINCHLHEVVIITLVQLNVHR